MDWFVTAFLKASLVWLALGVTLGVGIAVQPAWGVYYPAHVHMNLLGFVTMMIYGVAYHVIPRFIGRPLHARRLAGWHWWASNSGLAMMVTGFAVRLNSATSGAVLLGVGGTLSAAGAYMFAYNIWRTLGALTRQASPSPSRQALVPLVGSPPRRTVGAQ
jgi:cbb3-type cytochrome oxidase subunit 1